MEKPGKRSIPAEVDHLLKDRATWEEHYVPRLQYSSARVDRQALAEVQKAAGGDVPLGIYCGSMIGRVREWLGLVGLSYLIADDEKLVDEMIDTYANLCYGVVQDVLATGVRFDFGHFWEDMAFKSGPLVSPALFESKLAPHYSRIVKLLNAHGIDIVSLDCDGKIDKLVPVWLQTGVNTMCPIEVGTWGASIAPWRRQYGREIRGVGGMDKRVFSRDRAAVEAEVQRLKPLIELGGYIPCPDHRIAPDGEWDNVIYYCQRLREVFG
jgi:uroporphyrinogen decarboxylase